MILSDHNVFLAYRNVLLISVAEISTFSSGHLSGCDVRFGSLADLFTNSSLMSAFAGKADVQRFVLRHIVFVRHVLSDHDSYCGRSSVILYQGALDPTKM